MTPCVSCGREVSKAAKACPFCGQPWPKDGVNPSVKNFKKIFGSVLNTVLVLLALILSYSLLYIFFPGLSELVLISIKFLLYSVVYSMPFLFTLILVLTMLKSLSATSNFGYKLEKKYGKRLLIVAYIGGMGLLICLEYLPL